MRLIEEGLRQLDLSGKPVELYDPIQYFMGLGGKRLRPALCLVACELAGGDPQNAVFPALGIEVFHNFTLVHDDIMDLADVRRGQPTVHKKWNLNTAILSGDTMLVKAYQLVSSVDSAFLKPVLDTFSTTAIEVCEGQQYDMSFETEDPVTEGDYIEMIRLKTSVLLGGALKIGAIVGGADDETSQKLYDFGVNVGIAFQIQDDLLDIMADEAELGKKIGGDLLEGKKTYLLLKALENSKGKDRQLIEKVIVNSGIKANQTQKYKELYVKLGVVENAAAEVKKYTHLALNALKNIKNEEAKIALDWLAHLLTDRKK